MCGGQYRHFRASEKLKESHLTEICVGSNPPLAIPGLSFANSPSLGFSAPGMSVDSQRSCPGSTLQKPSCGLILNDLSGPYASIEAVMFVQFYSRALQLNLLTTWDELPQVHVPMSQGQDICAALK